MTEAEQRAEIEEKYRNGFITAAERDHELRVIAARIRQERETNDKT